MSELTVLVAVDVADHRVVRLVRGEPDARTVYGDDPVGVALDWQQRGAEWLHVVDLDAAISGDRRNRRIVQRILDQVRIPVQVSGGIRTVDAIGAWLDRGASRVVVGTRALDPAFVAEAVARFGDRVVAAIDARGGEVRVAGWQQGSGERVVDAVRRLAAAGVARVLCTDIDRDGTLEGPNLDALEELLAAGGIPVIASGGVAGEEDVRALARLAPLGLEGVVIGKALYAGALTLEQAHSAAVGA